jgi:N-acetylmuramoyl-L-alanine amidase
MMNNVCDIIPVSYLGEYRIIMGLKHNKHLFFKYIVGYVLPLAIFLFLTDASLIFAAAPSKCKTAECLYTQANNAYNALLADPKIKYRRDHWLKCIDSFKKVYEMDKDGEWAPAGLYMAGYVSKNLYQYSHNRSDLENAVDNLKKASTYKKSRFSLKAASILKTLPDIKPSSAKSDDDDSDKTPVKSGNGKTDKKSKTTSKNEDRQSTKDKSAPSSTSKTSSDSGSEKGKHTLVKALRYGSLPTRTRIVIDTDVQSSYTSELVKDPADKSKQRLDVQIRNSDLGATVKNDITIDDERVSAIHTSDKTGTGTVISIDIVSCKDYKIFPLRNPNRIVVDVWGQTSTDDEDQDTDDSTPAQTPANIIEATDLARQLQLGVKRIVVDPGHGGKDHGAQGHEKGVDEKDVVLSIGKKLSDKIAKDLRIETIMTRSDDTFITLEERTRIANRNKADLFISIHTNASLNKNAYGVETYFLNLARDKDSVAVAARENATSEKNISDLQTRSEERRVGKECRRLCRSRWSPYH